jgi:hypothetical protein
MDNHDSTTTPEFDLERFRYEPEAFKQACEELKTTKRQALTEALGRLEQAAWSRHWTALQVARNEIERLTGVTITGPLRGELEALTTDGVSGD